MKDQQILKKNGKIFLTYSASATDENYCMGMLVVNEMMIY